MARRKKKSLLPVILVILAIIVAIPVTIYTMYNNKYNRSLEPLNPGTSEEIEIIIPQGSTATTISKILEDNLIISDSASFNKFIKESEKGTELKAGTYTLSPSMSAQEILMSLTANASASGSIKFVVPEGFEIKNIAQRLIDKNVSNSEEFLALSSDASKFANDFEFLKLLPEGSTLEGYLFPATYNFDTDTPAEDVIKSMLRAYNRVYEGNIKGNLPQDVDLNELMTMASIIEREARTDGDRPLISSVFYNRIKTGMPLQSCATVQFILGERKPVLSIADTKIESPYNTYINKGLPPGPIANPGLKAIEAALNPAESDYLFFVLTGEDGSHTFTKTYDEHLEASKNMPNQ